MGNQISHQLSSPAADRRWKQNANEMDPNIYGNFSSNHIAQLLLHANMSSSKYHGLVDAHFTDENFGTEYEALAATMENVKIAGLKVT